MARPKVQSAGTGPGPAIEDDAIERQRGHDENKGSPETIST